MAVYYEREQKIIQKRDLGMVVDALMRFLPVQVRLELLAIRRLIGWPVVNLCSIFVLHFASEEKVLRKVASACNQWLNTRYT
jgi:hypothetical protein